MSFWKVANVLQMMAHDSVPTPTIAWHACSLVSLRDSAYISEIPQKVQDSRAQPVSTILDLVSMSESETVIIAPRSYVCVKES